MQSFRSRTFFSFLASCALSCAAAVVYAVARYVWAPVYEFSARVLRYGFKLFAPTGLFAAGMLRMQNAVKTQYGRVQAEGLGIVIAPGCWRLCSST